MQEKIKNWIKEVLEIETDFTVEYPAGFSFGDFATNVAMIESQKRKKNPKELAGEFVKILNDKKLSEIEKIEIAGPGFINFYLKSEFFEGVIREILELGKDVGKNKNLDGQKFIVEYTNTNVLKPMHIGHLMGNIIGESISRVIEGNGAEVKRNTYEGDVGLHIAKAVFGIIKLGGIKEGSTSEKAKYIGEAYALGANEYEEYPKSQEEIKEINKNIFEKSDNSLLEVYKWGREVSLEHFEELYKKLGTKFDFYFFESEVADDALKIVKEFLAEGLFEESDGSIIFRGEKFDPKLHTRVFVTKQNLPTYEAKDVAHAIRKYEKYKSDKSIIITANEQDNYFEVMLKALEQIKPEIVKNTVHLSHGMLRFADGKMSSRKGNVITAEDLINEVQKLVLFKMKDREMSEMVKEKISEMIAISALKYSILRQAPQKDIIFDIEKSVSFEGDSGPYLQYSAVRANSVLKKCESVKVESMKVISGWQTTNLEKLLERFPNVVERAGKDLAPHYIATYLITLAGEFNSFYATNKIIDDTEFSSYKIAITQSFANVMVSGLHLLGIKVPEEM